VLVLTGREARTLPPAVVRGLFWRIYAQQLWTPELLKSANERLPANASIPDRAAKGEAVTRLKAVIETLFPEDDDG
jgi:hypothetical protein